MNPDVAAQLILKGVSMMLALAEQLEADDLVATLTAARDEAAREIDRRTGPARSAH